MSTRTPAAPIPVSLGPRSYFIHFMPLADVPGRLQQAGLRRGRCLVVTDEHVQPLYLGSLLEGLRAAGWTPKEVVVPAGEISKAPGPLHAIYDEALAWGVDRQTPVLALGGGVVGDLAGFAAATLLRGLPLVQLPTTLIAQVDSAIGGKTGINHAAGKNLIGAFHQPAVVCADPQTLQSLPDREWMSGLAEVVKHALIADRPFLHYLEKEWGAIQARVPTVLPLMLHRAAGIKACVVCEDEREQGRRAILNFGHTFGHAIERVAGYGQFTHGEAVAVGMRAALHLSHALHPEVPLERANALVRRLPVQGEVSELNVDALMAAMQADKKAREGTVRFVVLRALGEAYVTDAASESAVRAAWNFALHTPT